MNKKGGRPSVITKDVLRKLEECFAMGGTDKDACLYSGISTTALYEYQKKNPEFAEWKQGMKKMPVLKALSTIYNNLDNVQTAKWFLERKLSQEYTKPLKVQSSNMIFMGDIIRAHEEHNAQKGEDTDKVVQVLQSPTQTSQKLKQAPQSSDVVEDILVRYGVIPAST